MVENGSRKTKQPRVNAKMKRLIGKIREANLALSPGATAQEYAVNTLRTMALNRFKHDGQAELFISLALESDRGCVLVAASLIDHELEMLLKLFFASKSSNATEVIDSLFQSNKEQDIPPLQSTMLKIKLAFVLGLIDEQLKSACAKLQRMRSIVFAHSKRASFLRHKDATELLYCFPDTFPRHLTEEEAASGRFSYIAFDDEKPRGSFVLVAMMMLSELSSAVKKIRRRQLRQNPGSVK